MARAPETLEGWYAFHDVRELDWEQWKRLSESQRKTVAAEFGAALRRWETVKDADEGASALYSVLGHKGDLMLLHLRPSLDNLFQLEREFELTRLADFTSQVDSYVSVTELSLYNAAARGSGDDGSDPLESPYVRRRLKPEIPDTEYVSFYPMDKRRGETYNWYALDFEARQQQLAQHGQTGRKYAGRVTQLITGSVGLDDWEWGVTLFADDPLVFKKLVYEMRFDEVSARYGEFGSFTVGKRIRDVAGYLRV